MPDLPELARLTTDPHTPRDERYDANAELWQTFTSQLTLPDLDELRENLDTLLAAPITKAFRFDSYWTRSKAPAGHQREHTAILYLNEFGLIDNGPSHPGTSRWLEKRSPTGFGFLRDVEQSVDLIAAIKLTRQRQLETFCRPERDEGPLGFRIVRRDGKKLTDADTKETARIEALLLHGGDVPDYFERRRLCRPDLVTFVKQMVGDSLVADACPIELTYTTGKKLSGWHNLDFTTIRLTHESGYEGDDEIRAVQVWDGSPRVAFGYRDLLYEVRNPRSDLRSGGYGTAEAELVIRAITNYLNTVSYNASGIDRSAIPRGLLQLTGKYDPNTLASFKRQWHAMLSGASQRHRIPILTSEGDGGVTWTPIDTFDEMYFARWLTFLVSITCAAYGIDPSEIHFDGFSVRPSSLSGSDTAEKLSLSRDKGLVPLVGFVERTVDVLVELINPKYRFACVGLHEEDAARKQERLKLSSTINEFRDMDGQEPHPSDLIGNAPTNQALLQLYVMEVQRQMGEQGQGQEQEQEQQQPDTGPGAPAAATARAEAPEAGEQPAGGGPTRAPRDAAGKGDTDQVRLAFAKARTPHDFLVVLERGDEHAHG